MSTKPRRDTKLESDGAEFLVLGRMLIERIATYKSYVNYPGYDLLAVEPQKSGVARIQVKSRFRTDWDGFIINNLDCDFVVFVALNRGFDRPKRDGSKGILDPHFYVLPIEYVNTVRDPSNKWGKVVRARLRGIEEYRDKWQLISDFLSTRAKPNTSFERTREG